MTPPRGSRIPSAAREGAAYAAAIGIARVTGIILLPVLTRRLDSDELGLFGLLTSVFLLLQFASALGLDSAATRWYYEPELAGLTGIDLIRDRMETISCWVFVTLGVGTVIGLVGLLTAPMAAAWFFDGTPAQVRAIRAASAAVPLTVTTNILQHWFRMLRRPGRALAIAIAGSTGVVVATVLLTLVGDGGVASVFGAQAGVGGLVSLLGIVLLRGTLSTRAISSARLRAMARYALPLLPAVAAPLFLGLLARALIGALAGVDEVGRFQVVTMIATTMLLFTQAFQQTWEPFTLALTDRIGAQPLFRTSLVGYATVSTALLVALAAVVPVALAGLGDGYQGLLVPTVVFSASVLIGGAFPVVNTGPTIAGTGRPALEAVSASTLGNLVLAAVLVPRWGHAGACWASLATSAVLVVVSLIRSERVWHVGFPVARVAAIVGAGTVATSIIIAASDLGNATARLVVVAVTTGTSLGLAGSVLFRLARELRDGAPARTGPTPGVAEA